jgi:hypothetical protein
MRQFLNRFIILILKAVRESISINAQEVTIMELGLEGSDMGLESCNGLMMLGMKENGYLEELMERESLYIQKVKSMRVNGFMIKHKVLEFTHTQTKLDMKVHGTKIYSMDKVLRLGLMVVYLKVNIN